MPKKKHIKHILLILCLIVFSIGYAQAGQDALKARRIVSMAPSITEIIFALEKEDSLVGVTDFCSYPPETSSLPKVGGYLNPNLEKLVTLRPDLVIIQGNHAKLEKICKKRGISILYVNMDSISTIYQGIETLGRALHCRERAGNLCTYISNGLESIQRDVNRATRQKVFICLSRSPGSLANLYTVGGSSFISEILKLAGGVNIFDDVMQPYPEASKESLIKRAPEIIIEMRPGENISSDRRKQIISDWDSFQGVPAIKNKRIHILTEDFILIPGPRVAVAARLIAETLHPEIKDGP
jgi:iron complex transport system substrate-binding protein